MRRLAGNRNALAALVVAFSLCAGVTVAALDEPGFLETRVDLHEAGVWVTKPSAVGRLNTQIQSIEVNAKAPLGPDVAQSGDTVVIFDEVTMTSFNASLLSSSPPMAIPAEAEVAVGGEVGMVADLAGGRVWLAADERIASVDTATVEETWVADGGEGERAIVAALGRDGVSHVYQRGGKELWNLHVDDDGVSHTEVVELDGAVPEAQVTAVGSTPVLLDARSGRVITPGREPVAIDEFGTSFVLQQPGPDRPDRPEVLVGTNRGLVAVHLVSGAVRWVIEDGAAAPVAPVWADGCAFGAWAGQDEPASYGRACDDPGLPGLVEDIPSDKVRPGTDLAFRVNRDRVVLNDRESGVNLTVDQREPKIVDNWDEALSEGDTEKVTEEETVLSDNAACSASPPKPKATADAVGTRAGRPVVVRVLDNDEADPCDVLTVELDPAISGPGRVEGARVDIVDGGGALQVTPDDDRTAPVVVPYVAVGRAGGDEATLTVRIAGDRENSPPKVAEDETAVEVGQTVHHNVLANDVDPEGDQLTLVNVEPPDDGTIRFQANGVVTYTAPGVNPGPVQLKYTVVDDVDGRSGRSTGTLKITVLDEGVNQQPKANKDRISAVVGREVSLNVLANDTDVNGDVLKLSTVSEHVSVTAAFDVDGMVRLTANQPGLHYVAYEVHDGNAVADGVVLVVATAPQANRSPIGVRDDVAARPSVPTPIDLLVNDVDPDGDLLAVAALQVPPDAGITVELLEMRIARVTVDASLDRPVVLPYTVTDGALTGSGRLVVRPHRVSGQDQSPIALPDEGTVRSAKVTGIKVLRNDVDPEGEQLTLVSVADVDPAEGQAFIQGDELRFVAASGASRTVRTTYVVADPAGNTASGEVMIRILDPADTNRPPDAPDLVARVFVGQQVSIRVPLIGLDPDGDVVSIVGVVSTDPPTLGSVEEAPDGFEYRATSQGVDDFTFTIRDEHGKSATGRIRVLVAERPDANTPPQAVPDRTWVLPGQRRVIPVLANDVDVDGDPLVIDESAEVVRPEAGRGTVAVQGHHLVYTAPDRIGEDDPGVSFTYVVHDGRGGAARGLVTVALVAEQPENRAPVARDDFLPNQLPDRRVNVKVLTNDTDPDDQDPTDGDKGLRVEVIGFPAATVRNDGSIDVELGQSSVSFVYKVTDQGGAGGEDPRSAYAVVSIPVPKAMPPVAVPDAITLVGGTTKTLDLLENDRNPGGDDADLEVVKLFDHTAGIATELAGAARGTVRVTAPAEPGTGRFNYRITNGTEEAVGAVTVTILPPPGTQASDPEMAGSTVDLAVGESRVVNLSLLMTPADRTYEFRMLTEPDGGVTAGLQGSVLTVSASQGSAGTQTAVGIDVRDDQGGTTQGRIVVRVAGRPGEDAEAPDDEVLGPAPVTAGDAAETREGVAVSKDVVANDVPSSVRLVAAVVEGGNAVGRATVSGRDVTFTPAAGFFGTALVTYEVADSATVPRTAKGTLRVTVYGRPSAPPTPSGRAESKTIHLTWGPAIANGSRITGYVVEAEGGQHRTQATSTSATMTGLANATPYRFRVAALSDHFPDPSDPDLKWSGYSEPLTPDQRPDSPASPTARFVKEQNGPANAGGVLHVTWTAPDVDGSAVHSYHVTVAPPSGGSMTRTFGANVFTHAWDGLENGTAYSFTVVAENDAGKSDPSGSSESIVPAGVPPQVTSVQAQRVSDGRNDNGGLATVSWSAASANGDPAGLRYRVTSNPASGAPRETTDTSIEWSGLSPTVSYSFTVVAFNKAGDGPPGVASNPVIAEGKPDAPANPTFLPGDNAVQLAGITSANTKGPGQVTYEFSTSGSSSGFSAVPSGDRLSISNGSTVSVWIRACKYGTPVGGGSPVGCGAASQARNSVTGATSVTPFGAPQMGAATVTDRRTITWAWADQGAAAVSRYQIVGQSGGTQTRTSYRQTFGYNETRCLSVIADGQGVSSAASGQVCATTQGPSQTVTISKSGTSAKGEPGCTTDPCQYISVALDGFPGGSYSLDCQSNETGGWASFWSGSYANPSNICYYGFTGRQVRVYVNGVESNTITW